MERIFVDKLFAAEAYVRYSATKNRAFEAAKHIYDLAVIANHPKIQKLIINEDKLRNLLKIRMEEEQKRLDGIPGIKPAEFIFFTEVDKNEEVQKAYEIMQNQYVLRHKDRIDFKTMCDALVSI